jgi:hypothetical protein
MTDTIPNLGAQDPELENSPVAWEGDEETETLRQSAPVEPFCRFNGQRFADGTTVKSGTILLRCSQGIWVPAGPSDRDNP